MHPYKECECGKAVDRPGRDKCTACLVKTELKTGLIVGAFYWVLLTFDPDNDEEWMNDPQPARYAGSGKWNMIGIALPSDWYIKSVGKRIKCESFTRPPASRLNGIYERKDLY